MYRCDNGRTRWDGKVWEENWAWEREKDGEKAGCVFLFGACGSAGGAGGGEGERIGG